MRKYMLVVGLLQAVAFGQTSADLVESLSRAKPGQSFALGNTLGAPPQGLEERIFRMEVRPDGSAWQVGRVVVLRSGSLFCRLVPVELLPSPAGFQRFRCWGQPLVVKGPWEEVAGLRPAAEAIGSTRLDELTLVWLEPKTEPGQAPTMAPAPEDGPRPLPEDHKVLPAGGDFEPLAFPTAEGLNALPDREVVRLAPDTTWHHVPKGWVKTMPTPFSIEKYGWPLDGQIVGFTSEDGAKVNLVTIASRVDKAKGLVVLWLWTTRANIQALKEGRKWAMRPLKKPQ